MVHDTAVGIDAIAVAPVRLAGRTRPALRTPDAPSRRPHGRGAGPLGDQQALGDGVGAEVALFFHIPPNLVVTP